MKTFILLMLLPLLAKAQNQPLTLRLELSTNKILPGEPLHISAILEGHDFVLPRGFSICRGHLRLDIKPVEGSGAEAVYIVCPSTSQGPRQDSVEIRRYATEARTTESGLHFTPGRYEISALYESKGPFFDQMEMGENGMMKEIKQREVHGIWEGQAKSTSLYLDVMMPTGVDLAALMAAGIDPAKHPTGRQYARIRGKRAMLIEKFPTSIYSGYVLADLYPILPGVAATAEEMAEKLTAQGFFKRFPKTYDHDNPPPEGPLLSMETVANERASQMTEFLTAHPDFIQREKIETQLVQLHLVLGNYLAAQESATWLSAHACTPDNRKFGTGVLLGMHKRGLIKPVKDTK